MSKSVVSQDLVPHVPAHVSKRAVIGKGVVPTTATKSLESLLFSADFKEAMPH